MQLLTDVRQKAVQFAESNAQLLLTAGGVVGTAATGVLAWRGGYKTANKIGEENRDFFEEAERSGESDSWTPMSLKDQAIRAIPYVLPPLMIGSATIASIIMGHKVSAQKAAALAAAYGLSQRQFEEYKDKVAEKLTGPKTQQIDDELAQDRVNRTPGHESIVVVDGEVLCFDEPTGRYFRSTMEDLKRAINSTNAEIHNHEFATASFFYEEIGLPGTTWTDEVGWNRDRLMDLKFTTALAPGDKPCISIDFTVLPIADYVPKHF